MTTTEDIALRTICAEVRAHGVELVHDYHTQRNSSMLTAIRPPSMDPIGERVSVSVDNSGQICASVFSPTGGPRTPSGGTTSGWWSVTAGLDTNDQRVLAVVNLLVPAAEQEKPRDGAPCGDCGESIVDGEDPWEWSADIGDFVHARCIDEPLTDEEIRGMTTDSPKREGILTVGELKAALEDIEDHVHVLITADGPDGAVINDGWWNNVADLVPPGLGEDQDGHFTFDLVVGAEFDTRQF